MAWGKPGHGLVNAIPLVAAVVFWLLLGLRDKIVFLAARAEQYLPLFLFFAVLPAVGTFADMIIAGKLAIVTSWVVSPWVTVIGQDAGVQSSEGMVFLSAAGTADQSDTAVAATYRCRRVGVEFDDRAAPRLAREDRYRVEFDDRADRRLWQDLRHRSGRGVARRNPELSGR